MAVEITMKELLEAGVTAMQANPWISPRANCPGRWLRSAGTKVTSIPARPQAARTNSIANPRAAPSNSHVNGWKSADDSSSPEKK